MSRMTVNKALTPLDEGGLIERRKRAGTFVRLPRLDSTVLDIPDIQHEITARGAAWARYFGDRVWRLGDRRQLGQRR